MRNFFGNYRGGASSRAGTHWVGQSKTPGSSQWPPRLIPFKFNLNQGYILEFGNLYLRIIYQGAYVTETPKNITGITNTLPAVVSVTAHGFSTNDWVFIQDVGGMTEVNGKFFIVGATSANWFAIKNLDGSDVNAIAYGAYTSGGTVARVLTVTTPYAIADLPSLKYAQSADVMTLTHNSYAPRNLTRVTNASWTLDIITFSAGIDAPASASATASKTTNSLSTSYGYVVTAVSDATGEESIASPIASVTNSVDIGSTAGTITVNWDAVTGAKGYNIYRSPAAYNTSVPSGVIYGFAGSATSTSFIDTNIVPDYTFSPPLHLDPFSSSSTWPGVVAYFQQRRVYANTNTAPNTYYMSKPGAYDNFDAAFPTKDDDAITGTPWAQQVNGIQFMLPMPGGLVVFTGEGTWQVNGGGGGNAITPADQTAAPQAYIGAHDHIGPIPISYDILYVQAKGSSVRDLVYNFYFNIYTSSDITILASHLFQGHRLLEWAYAEEPYKLVWAVRDDGILLSLTFLREQDIYAWARHDTNGLFCSVATVTEPPVDAVYVVVRRLVNGTWFYYVERFDNRLWTNVEQNWCVDAGLSLPLTYPDATLTPASATGPSGVGSVTVIAGGDGYSYASASIADGVGGDGAGFGATFSCSISGGSVTAITPLTEGQGYSDPTVMTIVGDGTGARAQAVLSNLAVFNASASVFSASNVGDVIRVGGGMATVTQYNSPTQVIANITVPITTLIPNNPSSTPLPAASGTWTISTPTSVLSGLNHLEGMEVAILADGSVQPNQTVVDGSVTLGTSASAITVGLPFTCQLQTPYLDIPGGPTVAGRRKLLPAAIVRVADSRGIEIGVNQPDASVQPNNAAPPWTNMVEIPQRGNGVDAGMPIPLFTGDSQRISLKGTWAKGGQVAVQQRYCLAANILAVIPDLEVGDSPG